MASIALGRAYLKVHTNRVRVGDVHYARERSFAQRPDFSWTAFQSSSISQWLDAMHELSRGRQRFSGIELPGVPHGNCSRDFRRERLTRKIHQPGRLREVSLRT